jgi:Tol biopolymer transport system component/DNA-binding winged helix-turn-helix (wHTH) protein
LRLQQIQAVLTCHGENIRDTSASMYLYKVGDATMSVSPQPLTHPTSLPRYRFGMFELDANSGELRRNGVKLRLQEQPFLVLRKLLEAAGTIVAREDLHAALWPADTFVDFDTSLNTAIKRLREVLGDSADVPVFIETIPRRGYRFLAPVQVIRNGGAFSVHAAVTELKLASAPGLRVRLSLWIGGFMLSCLVVGLGFARLFSMPVPRVIDSTQITFDGVSKANLHLRGKQIYLNERVSNRMVLLQIPVEGGIPVVFSSSNPGFYLGDVSADGTKLLVGTPKASTKGPFRLKFMDLASGSVQDMGGPEVNDASWAPLGKLIFSRGTDIFVANADGSNQRKLLTARGYAYHLRYSPDGTRLRFTVGDKHMERNSLWEAKADGSGAHEILTSMTDFPSRCCGEWSADGRYFFFQTDRNGTSRIWALPEWYPFWRRAPQPIELTTAPPNFYMGGASYDGRKLYVTVSQPRAELVRYDSQSRQFVPYLSGISAGDVETSRDGSMLTYIRYPEATLWRSKADGSEGAQITGPSLRAGLPHWSPDGKHIAFSGSRPGRPWNIFLVPSAGGPAEQVTSGAYADLDPTWSADGATLAFAQVRMENNTQTVSVQLLDLASRRTTTLQGSEGLCCPRWSPDGRFLAAAHPTGDFIKLYEFATGEWRLLVKDMGPTGYFEWSGDSKEIFFDTFGALDPAIYRLRISDSRLQNLVGIGDMRRYYSHFGPWTSVTPDGSPLLVRDISNEEVYSLDVQLP